MDSVDILKLIVVLVLVGVTAFFVAVEFSVVKVRLSRIEQLIEHGNKKAIIAKEVVSNIDYYLSACQLGITITSLGLGALGKPAIEGLLLPLFELLNVPESVTSGISYVVAFSIVTFLNVVVGEMAPKTLAIQYSEKVMLMMTPAIYWFGKVMKPFILALNLTSRTFIKWIGIKSDQHDESYSEEEIRIIMLQSMQGGEIDEQELEYVENVFEFDERVARDIMVPRTKMVTLNIDAPKDQILDLMDEYNYTRYPVVEGSNKDKIFGVINVKNILPKLISGEYSSLEKHVKELPYVFETTPVKDVLQTMKKQQLYMAIVFDEYGGTAGIVTLEDILEELVGEIRDEFDFDEVDQLTTLDNSVKI